jgi:protoporphyrinogen oxidase
MKKIAIIAGAGPAGLTAAYELLKQMDIHPIICESTTAIGGIAQTYNYKGNRIDIGGHRFFSKSDRVTKWWFNILPPQGKPAADTAIRGHEIEYIEQATIQYLCDECCPKNPHPLLRPADFGVQANLLPSTFAKAPADKKGEGTTSYKLQATSPLSATRCQLPAASSIVRTSPDPETEDDVMLQRPRVSRIFYHKSFFPYPIGITLTVAKRLGFINTGLIGFSYIWRRCFPIKDESYLDAFYKNRFGDRLYHTFFESYTEKVWGVPCHQIKSDWGAQRVKGLSLIRAVTHAIKDILSSDFAKKQKERETSLITRFYYPKFGPGQMWEEVARQVQCCGAELKMQTRVSGVHLEGKKVKSVTLENVITGKNETLECDYFFSTMPIKHLIGMMSPRPSDQVIEVAEGLQYRDFLTVGLLLKKLDVKEKGRKSQKEVPDNWIYIQEGDVRVGRVQLFNNWSPYMVADWKNTQWIGLEYFVNEGGDLWVMDDQKLIELGISEMEKIGMIKREDILDGCVLRMPKAYPAYFGSYDQLSTVQNYVDAIPNLFLVGRNGMHRYNNQDHSMLTAMLAVDNIAAGRIDKSNLWSVNLEDEYHEEKK